MALAQGTRLGPYEIRSPIGAGGMGEVYKARDVRLDRIVAVKVLAPSIASDSGLRDRFEREARAVAALDHPHICGIYDVGEADGTHFLVMPLLDGETLATRLQKGRLRLNQALAIATEIADALDKAHRQGIVHRDLKPANVMLTGAGAKLLDFGLAKLRRAPGAISMSSPDHLATTPPRTTEGTILGTLHYMAPEQVEGRDADARADIWALGATLYEMVTGVRPFGGDTPASVIGAILKDEPALPSSRVPLPAGVDHLVQGCLTKDPDRRWQSAADVRRELQWIARERPNAPGPANRRSGVVMAAISAIVTAFGVSAAFLLGGRTDASRDTFEYPVTFAVSPPPGLQFVGSTGSVPVPQFAVSPDGRHLVFVAAGARGRGSLWLRSLATADAKPLTGTDDAETPFWAPDGRSVGFFSPGFIKRKDVSSGAPAEVITKASVDGRGATWGEDETIVLAPIGSTGIHSVRATGNASMVRVDFGAASDQTQQSPSDQPRMFDSARWPSFLPDGRRFLFLARFPDPERNGIYVGDRQGGVAKRLVDSRFGAKFSSGFLLALSGSALVAHPFDPSRLQTTGPPLTVVEPVAGATSGFPAFSASRSGVLAYSEGLLAQTELWKVERSGTRTVRLAPAADYVDATLSPDGQRLAFSRTTESWQEPDIFLLDLKRGSEARLTTDPATETTPLWSPKGDRIIFRANRQSVILALWSVEPSPGSLPEPIFSTEQQRRAHGDVARNIHSTDWTRDGKFLVYHRPDEDSGYDISAVTLDGEGRVVPVTRSRHNEMQGAVSPDCAWIAFASDESGRLEVYLQSFPDASASPRIPISVGGGLQPHWSPDGRELYYLRSDGVLMAVQMQIGPKGLDVGASTPLFQTNLPTAMNAYRSDYAVSPDGKGFVMKVPAEGARPPTINVVLNWPTLLRK